VHQNEHRPTRPSGRRPSILICRRRSSIRLRRFPTRYASDRARGLHMSVLSTGIGRLLRRWPGSRLRRSMPTPCEGDRAGSEPLNVACNTPSWLGLTQPGSITILVICVADTGTGPVEEGRCGSSLGSPCASSARGTRMRRCRSTHGI